MPTPNLPPPPQPVAGNDKLLAILCHCSSLIGVGLFLVPLVVYLVKKDESIFVAVHAKEVLNFHLSLIIYCVVLVPLCFLLIGIPLVIILGIMAFVCAIIASIKASEGAYYFYPLTIRLIS